MLIKVLHQRLSVNCYVLEYEYTKVIKQIAQIA